MQRIQDMFINMEEVAEDAYKNTELLLSQYTKVMFRIEKNLVDIDYEMYAEEGKHLKEMLYDLVDFDATAEKRRIQEKLLNNDMNLCLLEIMRDSLIALRDYPKNGQLYYRLCQAPLIIETVRKQSGCMQQCSGHLRDRKRYRIRWRK